MDLVCGTTPPSLLFLLDGHQVVELSGAWPLPRTGWFLNLGDVGLSPFGFLPSFRFLPLRRGRLLRCAGGAIAASGPVAQVVRAHP